jgi:hypothetical protein
VTQAFAHGRQALALGGVGRGVIDLRELEREEVELALARAGRHPQLVDRAVELAHAGDPARALRPPRDVLGAAEAVEEVELGRGERESAMLVLTVEGEQLRGDLLQVGHGRLSAR